MAYYKLEPFGQDLQDFLVAQLTALTYNKDSRIQKTSAEDWIPWHRKPQQTPEEMEAILRSVIDGVCG